MGRKSLNGLGLVKKAQMLGMVCAGGTSAEPPSGHLSLREESRLIGGGNPSSESRSEAGRRTHWYVGMGSDEGNKQSASLFHQASRNQEVSSGRFGNGLIYPRWPRKFGRAGELKGFATFGGSVT